MALTSSPDNWPYGGMAARRSSTYSVPRTTVPAGADGVMVTSNVADTTDPGDIVPMPLQVMFALLTLTVPAVAVALAGT